MLQSCFLYFTQRQVSRISLGNTHILIKFEHKHTTIFWYTHTVGRPFPLRVAPLWGYMDIFWCMVLGLPGSAFRIGHFCWVMIITDQATDGLHYSVCGSRPHLCSAEMWPNNDAIIATLNKRAGALKSVADKRMLSVDSSRTSTRQARLII